MQRDDENTLSGVLKEGFLQAFRDLNEIPLIVTGIAGCIFLMTLLLAFSYILAIGSLYFLEGSLALVPTDLWRMTMFAFALNLLILVGSFYVMRLYWRKAKEKHPQLR